MIAQFEQADLLTEADRPRFLGLLRSTRTLLASRWTDVAVLVLACAASLRLSAIAYPAGTGTWIVPSPDRSWHLSLAGWWRTLVSQPIFLGLLFAWMWRLLLWARFLWTIAALDLRLVASHPDGLGGLRFLLGPIRGFAFLAFGVGVFIAGIVANGVILGAHSIADYRYVIGGHVLMVLALFAGPLLMLAKPLVALNGRGTLLYGRIATRMGHEFEARWGAGGRPIDAQALGAEDFSATTDLYSIARNVRDINLFVLDVRAITPLVAAALLPFVPLAFVVMPLDEIARVALKALA
jgi:hypothetical protein